MAGVGFAWRSTQRVTEVRFWCASDIQIMKGLSDSADMRLTVQNFFNIQLCAKVLFS